MAEEMRKLSEDLETMLIDLQTDAQLNDRHLLIIGCSTSEVIGKKIGTSGTFQVAEMIFNELKKFHKKMGVQLAFQCCEHLNRAVVMERSIAETRMYEEVTVIPAGNAGGAMATYAYKHLQDPVVVEFVKADAGIDIGDTLIGMHLKHVAVPIRLTSKTLGAAHVTAAKTRPKLIGGERAIYRSEIN